MPPGAWTRAWPHRRGFPTRPPSPPRRPPSPPPIHAADRMSHKEGREVLLSPRQQPQSKRVRAREENRPPAEWVKELAKPLGGRNPRVVHADGDAGAGAGAGAPGKAALGHNRDGGSSLRPHVRGAGPGAQEVSPHPLGAMLPGASGTKKMVAAAAGNANLAAAGRDPGVDTRGARSPTAVGGHHGACTSVVKSAGALHQRELADADGLRGTGLHGGARNVSKDREWGVGTSELQREESVPSIPLAPKARMASNLSRPMFSSKSNREARLHLEANYVDDGFGVSKGVVARDAGASAANQHVMGTMVSSSDVHLMAQENECVTNSVLFSPKAPEYPLIKVVYELGGEEKLDPKRVFNLKDDDTLRAVAICEGELILYAKKDWNSLYSPYLRQERKFGDQNAHARRRFEMICRRFEFICQVLAQSVDRQLLNLFQGRIDTIASRAMKELPDYSKPRPIIGKIPGLDVGDKFLYKVQLAILGLHRCCQGGIDWTRDEDGDPVAISIVSSGDYPDEILSSGELVYIGSGGKPAGKMDDQHLDGGNLALETCLRKGIPVRVIYGFKRDNVERRSGSKAKQISPFGYIYDGLYHVVSSYEDGEPGSIMFKYKLEKIPNQ